MKPTIMQEKREKEGEDNEDSLVTSRANVRYRAKQGTILTVLIVIIGYSCLPIRIPAMPSVGERLAFTLMWQLPSLTMLFLGIQVTAMTRFRSPAMNAAAVKETDTLAVHCRYVQNTLEQLVLNTGGQLVLTGFLEESSMMLIPVLVIHFCVGRILFWKGYLDPRHNRTNRAVGVAMMMIVTSIMYGYCFYRLIGTLL